MLNLNIEIQCCGLVILLLVGYFYLQLPKLNIRTKQVFGRILVVAILCTVTDILSVFAIYYADNLPRLLVEFACKIYLVFLVSVIFSGFIYLCADAFAGKEIFNKIAKISGIIFTIIVIAIQFLPINYVCENNGRTIYSYGLYITVVYIIFVIFFISMLALMQQNKHAVQNRRKKTIRMWLAIWLVSAILQVFNSSLLVVSFAGCLGVLIIFLMLENPELDLDKTSGFFHASVIPQFVNEAYYDKNYFLINTRFSPQDAEFFETIKNAVIFVGSGEIYLFFDKREYFSTALARISVRMDKRSVYVCEDKSIAENINELLSLLKKARELMRVNNATHFAASLSNVYTVDNEVKIKFEERKASKELINAAIKEDRVEPFYQPIYSIETGKFYCAEALARIRGLDGEIIPPYKFIPIAEETGLIIGIGKKMFEKTCEFLRDEDTTALGLRYIELNLSVIQGEDKQLADYISTGIDTYNIKPEQINLEITESASISGRAQLLENMLKLIERGVDFSLDDFGTGQSNLDYMTMMPVKLVKFDRTMTQSYFTSDKTKCVMSAAVNMIHEMGMKVVIEGVETAEQLSEMKSLGVDYIQGYYFSKPLCKADFIEFLKKNNKN